MEREAEDARADTGTKTAALLRAGDLKEGKREPIERIAGENRPETAITVGIIKPPWLPNKHEASSLTEPHKKKKKKTL